MQKIELGDSLLGYLPNLTEKRKVVEQRQVGTLEDVKNHYRWFEEKPQTIQAIFTVKEHVVRMLFTDEYNSASIPEPVFNTNQRDYSLKTGEPLAKPKDEYTINGKIVMKTEYDFGKYLVEKFDTLEEIQSYAYNENQQIQQIISEKETQLQAENQKREALEAEKKAVQVKEVEQMVVDDNIWNLQANLFDGQAQEPIVLGIETYEKYTVEYHPAFDNNVANVNVATSESDISFVKDEDGELIVAASHKVDDLSNDDKRLMKEIAEFKINHPEKSMQEFSIVKLQNESKNQALHMADDGTKMFEFQFYDELVPGSYDADKKTVKINFTARDTINYQHHQFIAEADVLSPINSKNNIHLSTARFFETNQDISKKLGVLDWTESKEQFKITLPKLEGLTQVFDLVDFDQAKQNAEQRRDYHRNQAQLLRGMIAQKNFESENGMTEEKVQTEGPALTTYFREDYDKYTEAKFNDTPTLKRTNPEKYRANVEANRLAWLILNIKHSKSDYDALNEGEKKDFYKSIRGGNNYIDMGLRGELYPNQSINVIPMYPDDRKKYLVTQASVEELRVIVDDARSYARANFKDNAFEVFYNPSTGQIVRSTTGKGEYLKVANVFSNGSFEVAPLFEKPEYYREEEKNMDTPTQEVVQEPTQQNIQELPKDPAELSQHALELVKNWSKDPKAMAEYLEFMSKFPDLSPRNVALIHSQWRGANAVATFDQWNGKTTDIRKNMPTVLGIKSDDVEVITRTITDKKTGESKTLKMDALSVRSGEKSQITLVGINQQRYFEKERDGKIQHHYEKYWTEEEKRKVANHEVQVSTYNKFYGYKVFEISQTNLKPETMPKIMPNRHINFEHDEKLVNSIKTGLEVYAQSLEQPVPIEWTKAGEVNHLGNAGGAFYPEANKIVMNHLNTPGENAATLIHELTHATLHQNGSTQKNLEEYAKQELEAEMTAFVVSKHYGIDTQERSIPYIAQWTKNSKIFDDKEMSQSLGKVQRTAGKMIRTVDASLDPELKKTKKIEQAHQRAQKVTENKVQQSAQVKQGIGR